MALTAPQQRTFTANLDCHYLLHLPARVDAGTLLVTALHGYGANPEAMLRLTATWFGEHVIASIQGPSQFFLSQGPNSEVGFSWVTHKHAEASIRLHHDMLLYVMEQVGRECGIGPERRILIGFSQPVGLNYRFAATHPDAVRGVIGTCGGIPRNWEDGPYQKVSAAVLHIARNEDEFYPAAVTEKYESRLRLRADDVEFHLLEGGHRFPSQGKPIVDGWLTRIVKR